MRDLQLHRLEVAEKNPSERTDSEAKTPETTSSRSVTSTASIAEIESTIKNEQEINKIHDPDDPNDLDNNQNTNELTTTVSKEMEEDVKFEEENMIADENIKKKFWKDDDRTIMEESDQKLCQYNIDILKYVIKIRKERDEIKRILEQQEKERELIKVFLFSVKQ